ncbi:Fc.00g032280.m01.CDS01 [Cosmosporella sp. VM-42]
MDPSQRIATLLAWASKHNAHLHPSIEVYHDAQTGLSFRVKPSAVSGPKPFEPIVSLPTSLTLSYLNAVSDEEAPFPSSFREQTPPHVIGRFFLVKQYLLGEKSFWWPYIQALPQPDQYSAWALPPFWPSDEAELLEGTNVEVGIEKIKTDVKEEYKSAAKLLADGWDSKLLQQLSLPLYQWAYSIFSSRSFRPSLVLTQAEQEALPEGVQIDDFSVLLPLFDIGNHDMTAEVRWDLGEKKKACDLKVAKEYQPGEQVFNNYSLKTNAELFLGYGFLIPETDQLHNDYTHVRKRQTTAASDEYYISLRPIDHPSSLLGRSRQVLQLSKSTKVLGAFQHVQHDMVWDIFCTLAPPDQHSRLIPIDGTDEAAEQERKDKFFAGEVTEEGKQFLQHTAAIIQHKVMQELERLDETEVEVVGDGDLTRNQILALDYRLRCRRVLEGTLEAMDLESVFDQ